MSEPYPNIHVAMDRIQPHLWLPLNLFSYVGAMAPIDLGRFPSALESGRLGIERAYELQSQAAQNVAEAGVRAHSADRVTLSKEAQSVGAFRSETTSIADGVLDAQVAKYMALASVRVVQTVDETASAAMDILSR